jgi:hypothetical protein
MTAKCFGTANLSDASVYSHRRSGVQNLPPVTVLADESVVVMTVADRERIPLLPSSARQLARLLIGAAAYTEQVGRRDRVSQ